MDQKQRRLIELDKKLLWHPFTQMRGWTAEDPLVIEKGEGSWLIDADGKRFLDGVSSLWCNVHGHRHPTIDRAVREQLEKIAHSTLLGLAGEASILFAEKLAPRLPKGLTRLFYSDNGATAAEIALKMAFSHQRNLGRADRTKFITFDGAYHGDTIGAVSLGGVDLFHEAYRPLLFKNEKLPYPFCFNCPFGLHKETCGTECFERTAEAVAGAADRCAGIVIEPLIQGASGMRVAPNGFLKLLRELCDRHGLLLIVDEVATGFGRTGTMFACEREGVMPDLMAMAKGISGGYLPLAATAATKTIYESFLGGFEEFKTFFHGHTYTGNALACAAGIGCLQVFEDENVLERIGKTIPLYQAGLDEARSMPHVADVRYSGFMAGIEIMKDPSRREAWPTALRMGHRIGMHARAMGVIIRPLGDVVVLNPPLCIAEEEIRLLVRTALESIREVTAAI
jgi:adenosylmethionine---8-amino-7-oxononanoate aminotransferase